MRYPCGLLPRFSAILDALGNRQKERCAMAVMRGSGLLAVAALAVLVIAGQANAQTSAKPEPALACGHFTQDQLPQPEPREAAAAKKRFEEINAAVKSQPYRVIFFGDSLTERFETWDAPDLWRQHMAARGVLNAGVNGDRTEHLRWRL